MKNSQDDERKTSLKPTTSIRMVIADDVIRAISKKEREKEIELSHKQGSHQKSRNRIGSTDNIRATDTFIAIESHERDIDNQNPKKRETSQYIGFNIAPAGFNRSIHKRKLQP